MAVQIGGINARITKDWLPFRVLYQDNADRQSGLTTANTVADGPARGAAASPYGGGVLLPDGRVLLAPSRVSTIDTFDPATGTVTTGPESGEAGWPRFYGAVMLPDGLVLLIPNAAANAVLYDPVTQTVVGRYPHGQTYASRAHFYGAVLARDGRVYMLHNDTRQMWRFDPETRTFGAIGSVLSPVSAAANQIVFIGSVLAPDGRIIFIPRANDRPVAFDPATLTWQQLAPHGFVLTSSFNRPFLGPDGKVYCPRGGGTAHNYRPRVYDPVADTWTIMPADAALPNHDHPFGGGAPLPGNRLIFYPLNARNGAIYDLATQQWTLGPEVAASVAANHQRGVLLLDGRCLLLANEAANHKIWTPYTGGTPLPYDYISSRYIGNRG